jgi:hypothetical protein
MLWILGVVGVVVLVAFALLASPKKKKVDSTPWPHRARSVMKGWLRSSPCAGRACLVEAKSSWPCQGIGAIRSDRVIQALLLFCPR